MDISEDEKEKRLGDVTDFLKEKYERRIISGTNKIEYEVIKDDVARRYSLEEIHDMTNKKLGKLYLKK